MAFSVGVGGGAPGFGRMFTWAFDIFTSWRMSRRILVGM